jgi:hypothetical protein
VAARSKEPRDPDVPRLPRGRGFKLSFGELLRIGLTAIMLIAVLVLAKPCADSVSNFVASFDPPDAQPAPKPKPAIPPAPPGGYVHITSDMTPQQIEQAIGAARDAAAPIDPMTRGNGARDAGVPDAPPAPPASPRP